MTQHLGRTLLVLCGAWLLASCASMSDSECRVADWNRVGLADGSNGVGESRLAAYAEDCGKAGVEPDTVAYRKGWDQGIAQYCNAANGWRAGLQGQNGRASVCVGQAGYETFARYLDAGLKVHAIQSRMDRNDSEARRLQGRLAEVKTDEEKNRIRDQLRNLDFDQLHLRTMLALERMHGP